MPLIFMPRRSALVYMLVLGLLCLTGGIVKKEMKGIIIGVGITLYALISLIMEFRKRQRNI